MRIAPNICLHNLLQTLRSDENIYSPEFECKLMFYLVSCIFRQSSGRAEITEDMVNNKIQNLKKRGEAINNTF